MPDKLLRPLLLSIVVAFGVSAVVVAALKLVTGTRRRPQEDVYPAPPGGEAALPPQRRPQVASPAPAAPSGGARATVPAADVAVEVAEVAVAEVAVESGPPAAAEVVAPTTAPARTKRLAPLTLCHWLTSGGTGFARGLNDTPKIVAIGAFALLPRGMTTTEILLVVTAAMAVGSIVGGMRVAERLGTGVVKMNHTEGFGANLTTAVLVGLGAWRGWPMSTTHVSTGAISGSAGGNLSRLSGKTLRDFAIAWTVTPAFSAVVAAGVYLLLR